MFRESSMMKDALAVPSASDSRQQRPRRRRAAADNVERDGAGVMGVGTLAPTGLELRADIKGFIAVSHAGYRC